MLLQKMLQIILLSKQGNVKENLMAIEKKFRRRLISSPESLLNYIVKETSHEITGNEGYM